jgi:hypothetical protein
MADRYGTAAAVKTRTGVQPTDLGLADDAALTAFLEGTLNEVTDVMDRKMRQTYLTGVVPAGLDGIANDAAADAVRTMMVSRQTPVVRIDDFAVRQITARVLAPDIVERLRLYAAGGGVASYDVIQEELAPASSTVGIVVLDEG